MGQRKSLAHLAGELTVLACGKGNHLVQLLYGLFFSLHHALVNHIGYVLNFFGRLWQRVQDSIAL